MTGIDADSLTRAIGFLRYVVLAYAIYYYLNTNNKEYEKIIFKVWAIIFVVVTIDLIFEYIFGYNTLKFKITIFQLLFNMDYFLTELLLNNYYSL